MWTPCQYNISYVQDWIERFNSTTNSPTCICYSHTLYSISFVRTLSWKPTWVTNNIRYFLALYLSSTILHISHPRICKYNLDISWFCFSRHEYSIVNDAMLIVTTLFATIALYKKCTILLIKSYPVIFFTEHFKQTLLKLAECGYIL